MTVTAPSSESSGWAPPATSMIASRVWGSVAVPEGLEHALWGVLAGGAGGVEECADAAHAGHLGRALRCHLLFTFASGAVCRRCGPSASAHPPTWEVERCTA